MKKNQGRTRDKERLKITQRTMDREKKEGKLKYRGGGVGDQNEYEWSKI